MRTTLDLPGELLRQAKIAAVERGTTLRELVGQALARELGLSTKKIGRHVKFPIFTSNSPGALDLSESDLAKLERDEDQRRHGFSH